MSDPRDDARLANAHAAFDQILTDESELIAQAVGDLLRKGVLLTDLVVWIADANDPDSKKFVPPAEFDRYRAEILKSATKRQVRPVFVIAGERARAAELAQGMSSTIGAQLAAPPDGTNTVWCICHIDGVLLCEAQRYFRYMPTGRA